MKPEAIISRELGKFATRLKTADGRLFTGLRRSRFTLVILLSAIAIFQLHSLPGSLSIGTLDAALILQPRTRPQKVRLVVIDDKDYATWFQGESPLDPKPLGQIITAIWKGQPSLIVVDLDTGHQKFRNLAVPPQARIVWAVDF